MADKTPVRVVFNESNVATGMAEFQSGDTVPIANGGTGLTAIGSAGQVLKVNGTGNGLEFGAEGDISITNLVAPTNADLTLTTSGTGNIVLDAVTVRGTTFSAADSTKITFAESVDVTGTLTSSGLSYPTSDGTVGQFLKTDGSGTLSFADLSLGDLTIIGSTISAPSNGDLTLTTSGSGIVNVNDSFKIGSGATVTTILDEDNLSTNSATALATQQSIKAYVDTQITAEDLDITADDSTAIAIDLDSETLHFAGGNGISTSVSGNTVTSAIDSTVVTLTGSQTLTNKTITSPTISTPTVTGVMTATSVTANDFTSNGSNADITIAPQGTGDINLTAGADVNIPANIGITFGDDGEKIEGDGTNFTISSSNNFTLDVANDVFLDAGNGNIYIQDDGTIYGHISKSGSNDFQIKSYVSDKDFRILGNDGGSQITALSFDMSEAGAATFNDDVTVGDDLNLTTDSTVINFGADSDTTLTHTDGTGLTLNSTNKLCFNDTGTFINSNADGDLDLSSDGTNNDSIKLASAGGITLDANNTSATGVINLDAHYHGYVGLKDNGTTYGTFTNLNASNFNITSSISDADMVFRGNDGGSQITALSFDMSEAGAATFNSSVTVGGAITATSVTTNDIVSNGSNAGINITPAGTGGVVITSGGVAFTLPTADGSSGDVLKTDGSGTLTFASSTATASDDTRVVVKNNKSVSTSARTVDYFQSTSADLAWYFVALNDLTNDHSSASCFAVAHNNSDAFISGARGGASGSDNSLPTTSADISSGQVRVKITAPSADSKISYYKIPISRANTADATAGVTVTTSNTDVDSSSESIDTFAHASFRAAKYLIIIDDNAKTETGVTEALVVHDGSNAFVTQHGTINTGNNDMITLSASISGSNVVLSAAGLTPNLSLKIHKTLLSDSMSAVSNANQKIIGATTVSSSATAFDSFDLDDATAAMYYVVGGNGTEGHYSVQEVYCSGAPGEAAVSQGPFVSTKGTVQLEFTAAFDADEDNTLQMSVSSTSGGSTTVNAYRINCLAE